MEEQKKELNEVVNKVKEKIKKQKKNKGRGLHLNFVDIILIVVIALIIAAVVFSTVPYLRKLIGFEKIDNTADIEYTLVIKGVDRNYAEDITTGKTVISADTKLPMGVIVGGINIDSYVTYNYYIAEEKDDSGNTIHVVANTAENHSDLCNIYITISVKAFEDETGYFANGQRIAAGIPININLPTFSGVGECINITIKD